MKRTVICVLAVLLCVVSSGARAGAAQTYQAVWKSNTGKTTITVDAQMVIPAPAAWPVKEVGRREFTEEEICTFAQVAFGDRAYSGEMKLKEMEVDSIFANRREVNIRLEGKEETWQDSLSRSHATYSFLGGNSYLGEKLTDARIQFYRFDPYDAASFYYPPSYVMTKYLTRQANGNRYTPKEAQDLAENTVAAFTKELTLSAAALVNPEDLMEAEQSDYEGYAFWFTRSIEGVHVTHTSYKGDSTPDGELDHVTVDGLARLAEASFQFETAYVLVSDAGIYAMHWISPYTLLGNLADNAALLPVEDILQVAEKIIPLKYMPSERWYEQVEATVDRIELGYARTRIKDSYGRYQLVPAWNFFGRVDYLDGGQVVTSWDDAYQSLLTVDAQTGLVIELEYGY